MSFFFSLVTTFQQVARKKIEWNVFQEETEITTRNFKNSKIGLHRIAVSPFHRFISNIPNFPTVSCCVLLLEDPKMFWFQQHIFFEHLKAYDRRF
jgi:uncharacterized membrane protein